MRVDHTGILKRSWQITWRYRALWVLGLFAGGAGGSFNYRQSIGSGSGGGTGGTSTPNNLPNLETLRPYIPLIIVAVALLVVIVLVLWFLSVAARGGLIWLGNEAAEGRPVRAGAGWSAGFHYWGRTFLIGFLLALPILAVLLVLAAIFGSSIVALVAGSRGTGGGAAAASGVLGICGLVVLSVVVLVPLGILIGVLDQLALRHGVLEDMTTGRAISMAWWDVRARFRDVALMWLLLLGVGIVYGIAVGIVAVVLLLPAIGAGFAGAWPVAVLLGFFAFLVLLLPTAVYNTFVYESWTIFFRSLTGREVVAAPAPAFAGGYPPPPPGYAPPPPPAPGGYAPPPSSPAGGYTPPAPSAPGGYPPPPPPGPPA